MVMIIKNENKKRKMMMYNNSKIIRCRFCNCKICLGIEDEFGIVEVIGESGLE